MAEIAGVVLGAVQLVTQCLFPSARSRITRWRGFKSNFLKLQEEVEKLNDKSRSILRRVDKAEQNGDGIEENVRKWLEKAKEIQENFEKWHEIASKFIGDDQLAGKMKKDEETEAAGASRMEIREDEDQTTAAIAAGEIGGDVEIVAAAGEIREGAETAAVTKKPYFMWLCSDLKMRHQLSKEAVKQLKAVVKHKAEAESFGNISYPTIPKDLRISIKDYEAFESRASTLKNVMNSLSDPNVKIVGIYGMGGIGKTTLVKQVANDPETDKLFDSVIFVEITEKPNIIKIQQEIAEKLGGLTFSVEETESTRAGNLYRQLENQKKNILIILDNIWVHLNLQQEIGIPLEGTHKCKVLLTARKLDVLEKMDSQPNFPVGLLDDEEAWRLFGKMTGHIEDSEIKFIAREVADACARLPIVIVTIARALRNKELFEWEDALQQMRTHSSENMLDIHKSIELSYNYLSPVLRKTIMLIRYANLTSIDELLMFGMGLDLFERIDKLEGRRARARTLVKQLKDSCLLLDSNTTDEDFSMHDVVRDAVISIASREGHVFTNELMDELMWPDENTVKAYHSIVLKDLRTEKLPQGLDCPQLKLLSLSWKFQLLPLEIPNNFFTRMTDLKVLVMVHMDSSSLPSSLRCLTNLRVLGLYNCQLNDIAVIGDLKKLEILSLKNCYIEHLPVEVGYLSWLKSLDLRRTHPLRLIPPNVLSSLTHLEELYMGGFSGWEKEGLSKDRKNASLDELKHMSKLTCLHIQIQNAKTLPRDLFFQKLERYKIEIGDTRRLAKSCRKFSLSLINTNICLNGGHIMQLKKIEDLRLVGSQDMNNVLYGLDSNGFQQLKYLQVSNNENVLCIVDMRKYPTGNAFPVLESLFIDNLINLEKICHGQLTTESSFSQLKEIKVNGCAKLENIFLFSIARRLQQLQSINVSDCENMKQIFAIEREDEEVIGNIKLSQLHSLRLRNLPQLRSLESNSNGFDTLFSGKVVLPSLEELELNGLNVGRIWQSQVVATSSGIQNLTMLIICCCEKFVCLFSSSLIRSFVRLHHLQIENCASLEEIIVVDETKDIVFSQLHYLKIAVLPNLTEFFSGDSIKFPSLKELIIRDCPKLKEFVVKNISTDLTDISSSFFNEKVALPNLECLLLSNLNVERIWQNQVAAMSSGIQNCEVIFDPENTNFEDPKNDLFFQKLKKVSIYECNRLKHVFPASLVSSLSQLEMLDISGCIGVEEIVFVAKEGSQKSPKFVFPRVVSLKLCALPYFTTFFSGRYTMEWPALKDLTVSNLNLHLESSTEIQPQFFIEKVGHQAFHNLEKLTIGGKNITIICEFPEDLICKIRYLNVEFDKSTVISSLDFLQRIHSIKCLQIVGFFRGRVERTNVENGMLANIRYLNECSDLKHILKEESNMDHLIHLQVESCHNLVDLVPSLTTFQNLTTLDVSSCIALTYIVTSSTAKSMRQLRRMSIAGCSMITELLLANEGDEAKDYEIVFSELKELDLSSLESLKSFCSANYTLKFPSLEDLTVENCPKMKSFCRGKLSTPKLQKVKHWREQQYEECWKGDLNTTIQHLYEEMVTNKGKEVIKDKEDVASSSNVRTEGSKEDSGQPST